MSTTAADATSSTTNSGAETNDGGTSGITGRAREKASSAYSAARERTSSVYASARETARAATERTSKRIDTNPVAAVVGGLALGGILAWVLPKTQRETEALSGVGHKITDTAKQAAQTALDAGKQQVAEIKENAATKVGQAVMDAVSSAASSGGGEQQ
jgi:ElaB/YqjD/DUF883 family membrane-anchored ribosome-binding protein